jgi:hypothetical protein
MCILKKKKALQFRAGKRKLSSFGFKKKQKTYGSRSTMTRCQEQEILSQEREEWRPTEGKKKLSSYFITFRLVRPKFLNPKSAHVEEVKICCCFFLNIWYLRNQQEWTNENKEHTHTQSVNHFLSTLFFSITTDAKWEGHISTWDFYRNKEVDIRFCLISICAGRRRRKSMCRPLFQFL